MLNQILTQDTPMPSHPGRMTPPVTAESIAAAKDAAMSDLRTAAVTVATAKGHQLGTWRDVGNGDDEQVAYCCHCWRSAVIEVVREPHLAGRALTDVCQPRPDAFLATQHESVTR